MKSILIVLVFVLNLFAQLPREAPPSLDSYLAVSTEIDSAQMVEAPRMEGSLHGVDNTPSIRTSSSIMDEVQMNQTRLNYLYKKACISGKDISRFYDLTITISSNGDVEGMVIKGITDKEFLFDMGAVVKTWSFSKVKDLKSKTVNLKHLDFMYRHELVVGP
jgi:hypothetical protein